jgi:O-antigen ligase
MCTVPYLGQYGIVALRDAVLWAYSSYAIIVAAVIVAAPCMLEVFLRRYRWFAAMFLYCAPVIWLVFSLFSSVIPAWPGSGVPIISIRSGDTLAHLAGAFGFFVAGIGGYFSPIRALLLVIGVGLAGSNSRGGLLAFLASLFFVGVMGKSKRVIFSFVAVAATVLVVAIVGNFEIPASYEGRPISAQQLLTNLASTVMSDGSTNSNVGGLEDTKEWRLAWWGDIYKYTVQGPYFFTGKGYGINLANSDGYQVADDDGLRSPHNSHLTFLARSGVPGLLIWIVLLCLWFVQMGTSYCRSRRMGFRSWPALFLFVMGYALAIIVNSMFDPALEGPMLSIWFWSIVGLGIGASLTCPQNAASPRVCHEI